MISSIRKRKINYKKIIGVCLMAILVLTQAPLAMNVSAQSTNELHWAVDDVRVPTGQNYVDLIFVLDWGNVTPFPVNAAILSMAFRPTGAFTLQSEELASGVPGFVTSHTGTIPAEPTDISTLSFTLSGMDGFEGHIELRMRLQIASHALPNVGDYVAIGVLRAAMPGEPAVITQLTIVRCDCGDGCSICDDAGGSGPPSGNGGTANGGTGNGGTGDGGTGNGGTGNGGTGNGETGNGGTGNGGTGGSGNGTGGGGAGTGGSGSGDTSSYPRQPSGIESGQTPGSGLSRFVPWTGDEANLALWLTLFGVGFLGIIGAIVALVISNKKSKKPTIVIKGHDGNIDSVISK